MNKKIKKGELEITATDKLDSSVHLFGMLADHFSGKHPGKPGGYIERMEEAGNYQLRNQTQKLPTEGLKFDRGDRPLDERIVQAWERMGIKVGEPDPADPIFCSVELPPGWELKPAPGNPHYWTDLVDPTGCVRAHMFYKAASYDRSCHIRLAHRFTIEYSDEIAQMFEKRSELLWPDGVPPLFPGPRGECQKKDSIRQSVVQDHKLGKVVFTSKLYKDSELSKQWESGALGPKPTEAWQVKDSAQFAREECEAWLKQNFPEWSDETAYWED